MAFTFAFETYFKLYYWKPENLDIDNVVEITFCIARRFDGDPRFVLTRFIIRNY